MIAQSGGWMKRHHYPEWRDASPEDKKLYLGMARRVVTEYLANVRKC
jgi:hypothetical protein